MADSGLSAQLPGTDASVAASFAVPGKDASTRLAAEYLSVKDPAQVHDANDSGALSRAATVLAGGLTDGVIDSAANSLNAQTATTVVESLAMGYGLGALTKVGPVGQRLAMVGGLAMGANWAYNELVGGRPQATIGAVADAYNSADHLADDRQIVASTGGALAFDTAVAFAAGGLGMKKGLNLKDDWHVDAAAAIKAKYTGAADFLSSDGRAHGAHLLGDGQTGMAFAGKDSLALEAKPALPIFSDKTLAILADKANAAALANKPYTIEGLPGEYYRGANGPAKIVPFSKAAEIVNPGKPGQSVGSFKEMGDLVKAQNRLKLGQSDPVAAELLDKIVTRADFATMLDQWGDRLTQLQAGWLKPHGKYADEVKTQLSQIVAKQSELKAIEEQAKNIQILRLEAARITNKLNIINGDEVANGTTAAPDLKSHLQSQHDFLQDEIGERSRGVGSVKDPLSPISMARAEFESRRNDLQLNILMDLDGAFKGDAGPARDLHDYPSIAKHASYMLENQDAIAKNIETKQTLAVQFSDAVYAYEARLDALQNVQSAKAIKAPPYDARVQSAAALDGPLRDNLKGKAISLLSTDVLGRPGALDRATNGLFERSTVVLFQDGKPVTFIGRDLKPHMALLDVRNFDDRLAQMPDAKADGYAILSPLLQAGGSLAILRQETAQGQPTRTTFKKAVTMVGGNVPKGVGEGTSLGKLFALFSRPEN